MGQARNLVVGEGLAPLAVEKSPGGNSAVGISLIHFLQM